MIKAALLSKKCKKLSRLPKKDHVSYFGSSSIGILFNSNEYNHTLIEELKDSFSGDGKEIAYLAYSEKESDEKLSFCKKDISVSGKLNKDQLTFFTNQSFDFLVSLDTSGDINYKYVLALSKAICKVGINAEAHRDLLTLSFEKQSDQSQNIRDIIKYLKKI